MARIIGEVMPKVVFVENSSQLVGRGLGRVISDLSKMGYTPRWGCMGGHTTGSITNGERIWIVAYASDFHGWEAPSVQSEVINSEESWRRQFERASSSFIQQEDYSDNMRGSDEVSDWVDRIAAVGNAQDPILAREAFRTLTK